MALFQVTRKISREQDSKVLNRVKTIPKAKVPVSRSGGIIGIIQAIQKQVEEHLGKYVDEYEVITSEDRLKEYFQSCLDNLVVAIDTETTGLNPMLDKIVGLCLYTPGQKGAYIPINHVSYITGQRTENQLNEKQVGSCVEQFLDGAREKYVEIEMFNAKFDIRVIRNQLGVKTIYCTWDCYLAARLMNENEGAGNNGLKALHRKYVLKGAGDAYSFGDLFKNITFDKVPINLAYLYAARDPVITHELAVYQKRFVYCNPNEPASARNGMNGVSWVFFNIEMPCVPVICDMEDNGILIDPGYARKLYDIYSEKLVQAEKQFHEACEPYACEIAQYRAGHTTETKLDNPINIGSSAQIAILVYDILKIEPPDPKSPRGTGEPILAKIDNPIAKAILDYREVQKLMSTYISKLPTCANPNDGRIHCSFNQYGADTGRMSSSDPNLQNIPSHNKDIRKMFIASPGYVLMSSDFSQQEPKCLAALCRKAGDSQMYDSFMAGKDLYSEIASKAFNKPYEECREFREDGTTNKAGKERRTQAKSILLGVLYGRGEKSIAEQLGCTEQKAKSIKQSVFRGFPAIEEFERSSLEMARNKGYVTTVCGRKRRLPDLQLPEYEFEWKDGGPKADDLLDFTETSEVESEVPKDLQNKYLRKLKAAWGKEKRGIFDQASKEGIHIIDNGGKIADATRQCVNSRIQGSAADLTKLAMIRLNNNPELKELGFRLLIPVHDEVIAECPEENVKKCAELLAKTMSDAAQDILEMPVKCDVAITREWYGEEIAI